MGVCQGREQEVERPTSSSVAIATCMPFIRRGSSNRVQPRENILKLPRQSSFQIASQSNKNSNERANSNREDRSQSSDDDDDESDSQDDKESSKFREAQNKWLNKFNQGLRRNSLDRAPYAKKIAFMLLS